LPKNIELRLVLNEVQFQQLKITAVGKVKLEAQ